MFWAQNRADFVASAAHMLSLACGHSFVSTGVRMNTGIMTFNHIFITLSVD